MHQWLKDLGIKINKHSLISWKGDSFYFFKQRRKYGFDERECYNLDITTAYWLYEHLKMLYSKSKHTIDWGYNKEVIPILKGYDIDKNIPIWYEEEQDLQNIFLLMMRYLKEYLTYDNYDSELTLQTEPVNEGCLKTVWYKGNKVATDEEINEDIKKFAYKEGMNNAKLQTALMIYSKVIHYMWW